MNKLTYLTVIALFIILAAFSQSTERDNTVNTINEQFEYLYSKSSNYKEYKVVKKAWLLTLQANLNDSLRISKQELKSAINNKNITQKKIDSIKNELYTLQKAFKKLDSEKQQLSFLGISMFKENFKALTYFIVLILLLLVAFLFYKFKECNTITKSSVENLNDLEEEFANYKKRAIEREQLVRRQLQDELNKQKKK